MQSNLQSRCGFTLIEVLIYLSLMTIFIDLSYLVYLECQENHFRLQCFSNDTLHSMDIGERWREDVRKAIKSPILMKDGSLKILQQDNEIHYFFQNGTILRQQKKQEAVPILRGVKSSQWIQDQRKYVRAWRWEVELITLHKKSRIPPLFSFETIYSAP